MKRIELIGIVAAIIGVISYIPVIINVYRTKKTNNFPYYTLILALVSNLLWIIYGVFESTYANIMSGIIYFTIYLFILYIKSNTL